MDGSSKQQNPNSTPHSLENGKLKTIRPRYKNLNTNLIKEFIELILINIIKSRGNWKSII
jgi:hypothetical protein